MRASYARLTRVKLRSFLTKRYRGQEAVRILDVFDFSAMSYDFDSFYDHIEKLLNFQPDKLKKIAFSIYDFNEDKVVCELDLYAIMVAYRGSRAVGEEEVKGDEIFA